MRCNTAICLAIAAQQAQPLPRGPSIGGRSWTAVYSTLTCSDEASSNSNSLADARMVPLAMVSRAARSTNTPPVFCRDARPWLHGRRWCVFNISLSRLVPLSPRNTDATRRFVFRSRIWVLAELGHTPFQNRPLLNGTIPRRAGWTRLRPQCRAPETPTRCTTPCHRRVF